MKYKPNSNTLIPAKIQRGFTILEVIIVLVIAAIIMLAVFVVVPQLQNSQKNNSIRSAANRVLAAVIEKSQTSNPPISTTTCDASSNYILNGSSTCPSDWLNGIIGPLRAPNGASYAVFYRNQILSGIDATYTQKYDTPNEMLALTGPCGNLAARDDSTVPSVIYSLRFYQYQYNGSAGSGCIDNK